MPRSLDPHGTREPISAPRRRDLLQAAALWAATAQGLAAAQPLERPGSRKRRGLLLNLTQEPDSLDPTTTAAASVGEVVHYNVLEGLTRIEESGQVTPLLAQSWELSSDGRSCRFVLRENVRFHDGSPLEAEAVRFSFERAAAPGSGNKGRRALFDNIASIASPDARTVVLQLHRPDAHLPFRLGEATAVILHPATAGQAAQQPVGTGPYRVASRRRGHSILLERAPHARAAQQVHLDQATFRFIHAPEERQAAFREGEVDLFFQFATQGLVRNFHQDARYQMLVGSSSGKGLLALNHRRPPLSDVRVRRAITHAIDREEFIHRVLNGLGVAIGSHFAPTDPGYLHLASLHPHDPDRARALLREAGVGSGLSLSLALPPAPYAYAGGDFLAEQLARVGIQVKLQRMEWPQWFAGPFRGDFDMTLINHVEPLDYLIYADPQYYFGYDSAQFRTLAQRHAEASSGRERQQLFAQMQRHLALDAASAWIFNASIGTVVRKGLRGVWMNYPIFAHDIAAMGWDDSFAA